MLVLMLVQMPAIVMAMLPWCWQWCNMEMTMSMGMAMTTGTRDGHRDCDGNGDAVSYRSLLAVRAITYGKAAVSNICVGQELAYGKR